MVETRLDKAAFCNSCGRTGERAGQVLTREPYVRSGAHRLTVRDSAIVHTLRRIVHMYVFPPRKVTINKILEKKGNKERKKSGNSIHS